MTKKILYSTMQRSGRKLAFRQHKGDPGFPGLMFCPGFRSDMEGTKAQALFDLALKLDRDTVLFDYSGHGASPGAPEQFTIGDWFEDALSILDEKTRGKTCLVGSSMGGWMAMLLARARPEKIASLLLIAPAPDFVKNLFWTEFSKEEQQALQNKGYHRFEEEDGTIWTVPLRFFEESETHHLLDGRCFTVNAPVRILHGLKDKTVPWEYALRVVESIDSPDCMLTLMKDGDHSLSDSVPLRLLLAEAEKTLLRQTVPAL